MLKYLTFFDVFLVYFNFIKVWSYLYTTAGHAVRKAYLANGGNPSSGHAPLAGLGYGLPLRCVLPF